MKFYSLIGAASATKIVSKTMAQLDSEYRDVDGQITCDTVASDLSTFTKYWGIDLKTTWLQQPDVEKQTLWKFLNHIDSEVSTVQTALGVSDSEQVSLSVQVDDATEEIL